MARRGSLTVRKIRTLRWLALGTAGVLAGVIAVLWWVGRSAKPEEPPKTEEASVGAQEVGKGFDHTVTHEGRPLLRIRGKRDRRDRQGNLHVDEVLITAYQPDGSKYEVTASTAVYSLEQKEAQLDGNVALTGPNNFHLRTSHLDLKDDGHWLESQQMVLLEYGTSPPLFGRAQELHAQINRGEFFLAGGVHMHAQQPNDPNPWTMNAKRVVYQREMHQLRAEGDVLMRWGESSLHSDRMAAHIAPETNKLQFVRARWQVKAIFIDQDEQGRRRHVRGEGTDLAVLLDEEGKHPTHLELQGEGAQPAHLERGVAGADLFDLTAPSITADMAGGHVTSADADGGVLATSQAPQTPPRKVTAKTANASFASDGALAQLELEGGVEFAEQGQGTIHAQRAVLTPERSEAFGQPVVLVSPRGELRAPRLVYTKEGGVVHAVDGVEATMQPNQGNPMHKTPLAQNDQPVHVQSEEAFWSDPKRSFLFKGKVRAWSADRVLTADQLRGEDLTQQLAASGNVETVWFVPPPEHPKPGDPKGPQQVRVNADTLTYSDRAHELVYDGNVRVVQTQRTLQAKTVTVDLTEKNEAKRMLAAGGVNLQAPVEGRSIVAETADYDVPGQVVLFRGNPVTVKDQKGGTLNGKQAVYSMAKGTVRVTAEEQPASGGEHPATPSATGSEHPGAHS